MFYILRKLIVKGALIMQFPFLQLLTHVLRSDVLNPWKLFTGLKLTKAIESLVHMAERLHE